jgi:O-antigen ligase
LLIALISTAVADYKILALKKFLFLVNVSLLFLIVRNLTHKKEQILKVWQAAAVGGITVLAVALIQFLAVLFVPLFDFWQFWATKIINALYGQNLAHLLSYSNTWFAYYQSAPPTLRLFSVFPDSHSFAMFSILLVPIFLGLAFFSNLRKKRCWWIFSGLALGGIVLSGSRGAWLSILPVITVAIYLWGKKIEPILLKKVFFTFFLFVFLFLFSVGYPPLLYKFQSWQTGGTSTSAFLLFERARSISDLEEISNKGRLEIWRASAASLKQHPFLGVGLGNFITVIDEKVSAAKKGASAHNLYLDFATEIGILGTLFLIAAFTHILYSCWLIFRCATEPHFKIYGLLFGLYLLWVLGYSFFDVVLLNDKVLLLFMVGSATLYSLRDIYCNPEKI